MTTLFNIAKMTVSSAPGVSDIPLNAAVTGWLSFSAAGATNGVVVAYNAVDGSAQEDGTATYSTTGPSLTGRVLRNSTTGSLLSLSSSAIITLTASKEDIVNKTGDTMTGPLDYNTEQTIASATTTNLATATSNTVLVSGTTTITGFGTIASGAIRYVRFSGILLLTYNATSMILPGAANITTAAGDTAIFESLGSGNWQCLSYQRANGGSVVAASSSYVWLATLTASSSASLVVTSSVITATYDQYVFELEDLVGDVLYATLSSNNGSSYISTGYGGTYNIISAAGSNSPSTMNTNEIFLNTGTTGSGYGLSGSITFTNPNSTTRFKTLFGMTTVPEGSPARAKTFTFSCINDASTAAINNVKFYPASSTITSGKIHVYGVKRS